MSSFSSLAERIVCINLRERDDRYEMCLKRFADVGLLTKEDDDDNGGVQFLRVERHPKGGVYGCYDSHRTVMQQAYDDGLNSVLIFEDDVEFQDGWEQTVKEAKHFLDLGIKYDALMFGPELKYVEERTLPTIWRVKCVYAHAYIVSREGMKRFISNSEIFEAQISNFPQDVIQNSVWQNIYGHINSTSIQQDNDLATDLNWLPDIIPKYAPWFQNTLVPKYFSLLRPIIRSNWWSKTWLGSHYVLGMDRCIIDDGRIRLVGLWPFDMIILIILMLLHKPPFGYFTLYVDFVKDFPAAVHRRFIPIQSVKILT